MTVGLVGKNLWMIYCKAPFDPELTTSAASNFYQGFDAYMLAKRVQEISDSMLNFSFK